MTDPMPKEKGPLADMALINGHVYTVNRQQVWAEAIAVSNGRFIAVGNAGDISACIGPETHVIDLGGKMVLPGLIDSHAHASCATNETASLEMFHLESLEDYLDAVRAFAADHPEHEVIYGGGWHNDLFPPTGTCQRGSGCGCFGPAGMLDVRRWSLRLGQFQSNRDGRINQRNGLPCRRYNRKGSSDG